MTSLRGLIFITQAKNMASKFNVCVARLFIFSVLAVVARCLVCVFRVSGAVYVQCDSLLCSDVIISK